MKLPLNNKVVIVAGGSGLIGRNFVSAIVNHGGLCIVADVNIKATRGILNKLGGMPDGKNIDLFELDITSKKSILRIIDFATNKYGKIDAIVNAAYPRNRNWGKDFEAVSFRDFCENVNLQLGGAFLVSQQFGVFFKKQGYGNILNLSSIYGVVAPRFEIYGNAAFHGSKMTVPIEYAAIKSAIIHLTKFMAKYFKGCNIRVNCISPGGIFDNQSPEFLKSYNFHGMNKGMLDQADLNGTLVYLLSDNSKCVNGQNIIVDDGWTL